VVGGQPAAAPRPSGRRNLYIAGAAVVVVAAILAGVLIAMSGGGGGSNGGGNTGGAPANAFLPRSLVPLDSNTMVFAQQSGSVRQIESVTVPAGGAGKPETVIGATNGTDRILPVLTPDRRTVIYNVVLPGGSIQLRAISADGSSSVADLLTTGKVLGIRVAPDSRVTVDPTGNFLIVKLVAGAGGEGGPGLYVIKIDGTSIRQIPNTENATDPSWGPTGTLVYADGGPNGGHLFTVDANDLNAKPTQITEGPGLDGDAAWSSDGKKIVFRRADPANLNNSDIFVLTVGSTSPVQVTHDGARNQDPTFSAADTNTVSFTGGGGVQRNLLAINVDGTNEHEIAPAGGIYFTPRWVSG
jgi:Tol biopolymer transport system component